MRKPILLKRERINQIFSDIYDYPLIIVEAPMGFGKSTAIRSFLSSEKIKPLWLTIMNADEGTFILWNKFTDEIEKIDSTAGNKLRSLGMPVDAPQKNKVLSILNSIEFSPKTVLVIDDYHLCQDKWLGEFLLQIASEDIENFHIIIVTRDTTNINFTELLAKGMCSVISQNLLKFNKEEVYKYCSMMTEHISEIDLEKIIEYTDGWISLIYMIVLALEKGIPVGMNNNIDQLVENSLFNEYTHHIH